MGQLVPSPGLEVEKSSPTHEQYFPHRAVPSRRAQLGMGERESNAANTHPAVISVDGAEPVWAPILTLPWLNSSRTDRRQDGGSQVN